MSKARRGVAGSGKARQMWKAGNQTAASTNGSTMKSIARPTMLLAEASISNGLLD
jgi:hypothetical protein